MNIEILAFSMCGEGTRGRREFGTKKKNKFELKNKGVLAYLYRYDKLLAISERMSATITFLIHLMHTGRNKTKTETKTPST